jgi:hypothetical protein
MLSDVEVPVDVSLTIISYAVRHVGMHGPITFGTELHITYLFAPLREASFLPPPDKFTPQYLVSRKDLLNEIERHNVLPAIFGVWEKVLTPWPESACWFRAVFSPLLCPFPSFCLCGVFKLDSFVLFSSFLFCCVLDVAVLLRA